jgi:hypothetical protein
MKTWIAVRDVTIALVINLAIAMTVWVAIAFVGGVLRHGLAP